MQHSLAIAFTTIGRPRIARRFVEAARLRFPTVPIYVADQSQDHRAMSNFYKDHDVHQIRMAYDAGLSASRNRLMAEIVQDYVWLCDDDHLLYGDSRFDEAIAILEAEPEIAVVGGRIFEVNRNVLRKWHWEMFLHRDERNGVLTVVPIYHAAPILRRLGRIEFYLCDAVHNFAIFRRSVFNGTVKWDERLKINGEHEDFYLNLKYNSPYRAAYLPTMAGFHLPAAAVDYPDLRSRTEFWRYFKRKWNVNQYVEVGTGLWLIDDAYDHLTAAAVAERFYLEADGPLRRGAFGCIGVAEAEMPPSGGATRAALGAHGTGAAPPVQRRPPRLEAGSAGCPTPMFDPGEWRISCRYEIAHPEGTSLVLWCLGEPERSEAGDIPPILELRSRWFAADGRVLVWETRRVSVALLDAGEWRPAWFEVPLLPRDSGYLRFEIVAESATGLVPLCCGFLLPEGDQAGAAPAACDVLALTIAGQPPAGLGAREAGPHGNATSPVTLLADRLGPAAGRLLQLRLDPSLDAAALWFARWPATGHKVVCAHLPKTAADWPPSVAIPDAGLSVDDAEIWVSDYRGQFAPALIRHADASGPPAAAFDAGRPRAPAQDRISVVLTSCGRQDLLERTLDSFFAFNTAPVAQFLVVEDGTLDANALLIEKYRQHGITWLATSGRVGQIAAIDHAYALVEHPYIFHMEDDWEFYHGGFIENSLQVLEAFPDCLQIWLRALDDTNGHPLCPEQRTAGGIPFRKLQFDFHGRWHGFSFNPGLRRTADYRLLGKYGWFVTFDANDPSTSERAISEIYRQLGFYASILGDQDGSGYLRHIGWDRTVGEPMTAGGDVA
ncbi:MAG: glycosyltransferase [Thiohalocapsa sp.]